MNSKKNYWPLIGLLLLLAIGAFYFSQASTQEESGEEPVIIASAERVQPTGDVVKVFIAAREFEFEPNIIRAKKGDLIVLNLTSEDVTHGLTIPEYNLNALIEPGKTTTLQFIASKAGTFDITCYGNCSPQQRQMTASMIITE